MAKRWYVLHVFSGSEKKVAQSIREQVVTHGLEGQVEDVMVPTENVVEVKRGALVTTSISCPSLVIDLRAVKMEDVGLTANRSTTS